jgi:hypothetical protein
MNDVDRADWCNELQRPSAALMVMHNRVLVVASLRHGTPTLGAATLRGENIGEIQLHTIDELATVCAIIAPLTAWQVVQP